MWISPLLAVVMIYAQVRDLGFVWDDTALSLHPVYRDCDLGRILTSPANQFEYLPVRDLSLCVDHALFGADPVGFHSMNVLIFMAAALLVRVVLRKLFAHSPEPTLSRRADELSWICTLLYCVHPLQVEPVAFVTCRNSLLALFFVVASLAAHLRDLESSSPVYRALSILAAGLALFSKATALPIALLVPLVHLYMRRDEGPVAALKASSIHLVITAAAVVLHLTIASQRGVMRGAPSVGDLASRLPKAAFIPQFYIYKILWPANLSVEYIISGLRDQPALVAASVLAFGLFVGVVIWRGLRARTLSCLLCLASLAAFLPILNLVPSYPPVADRYVQIPLLFVLTFLVTTIVARIPRLAGLALVTCLFAVLSGLSYRQVGVWESSDTLFTHAADVEPGAILSVHNLAHMRWWRGEEEAALEDFKRLSETTPDKGQYELFSGWYAIHQQKFEDAESLLTAAEQKGMVIFLLHMAYGDFYAAKGNPRRASAYYDSARRDAEKFVPNDPIAVMTMRRCQEQKAALPRP